ncbi:tetratricopeptide repeat protein [Chthonobacter rhizosphaerae]|uniref:tetratricopeptide repeat protein n=1 Tax=Chthonobacter rhizosphaerae TaxID=2735553 RepID=UPI0015EE97C2|nr:tetratricopeptide repeat protein [Chthonobacter rhizosphaerae]
MFPAADRLARALDDHRAGRLDAAAAAYCEVLEAEPENPDALHLLGVTLKAKGALDEAIALMRRATDLAPGMAAAWSNLGNALARSGDDAGAAEAYGRALHIAHDTADVWCAYGAALKALGDRDGALRACERAHALDPDSATAAHNLANLYGERGRDEEAVALLRRVLAAHPDLPEAHYNLARLLLRFGDDTSAWRHYEWRWQTPGFPSRRRHVEMAAWDGAPLKGSLLVHTEQGLGDCIQFARLAPLARSLAGSVTLEVPARLARLFRSFTGVDHVIPDDVAPDPHNAVVPLMSLPHRLGLTLGSVPRRVPYLAAEPDRVARWRARLGDDGRRIVALVHKGNPASPVDRGRSIDDLGVFAGLAALTGIRLISLQKLAPEAIEAHGSGHRVAGLPFTLEHAGPDLDDGPDAFLDTAAVMTIAERIVSTDTAAAHLAGALGRPVHILLQAVAEWRWLRARPTSPWYPTARLHRQVVEGDWADPVRDVTALLASGGG